MADAKAAWNAVGDRLSALGLKLKLHTDEETSSDEGKETASGLEKLKTSISEVFDALGDAARDPAVREDAKSVASAFAEAIDATIDDARKAIRSKQSGKDA
jgi:hypothetical protein